MWHLGTFVANDIAPTKSPPLGPYWCEGYGPDNYPIIRVWWPDGYQDELTKYWPTAREVFWNKTPAGEPVYDSLFPKPDWFMHPTVNPNE